VLNIGMIYEYWIGKDMEKSSHGRT
jgi:hypothetical protein